MATSLDGRLKSFAFYFAAVSIIFFSFSINGLLAFLANFRNPLNPRLRSASPTVRPPFPGKDLSNTFWFVHVTDLHISEHKRPEIASDLEKWCVQMHDVIKPQFILVTGDLTDAKAKDQVTSYQHKSEWQTYKRTRDECYSRAAAAQEKSYVDGSRKNLAPWIDIRGNHDSFDMDLRDTQGGPVNWFKQHVATEHHNVSHFVVEKQFGKYSFVGVDFSPNPGPSRPLNFFGYYDHERDGDQLAALIESESKSNLTFFYGHHTLNVVTSSEKFFATLRYGAVYLCGHLHALLNSKGTQHLYGYHHLRDSSLLELELGDFQTNRRFRVMAVDHDMISFTDVSFNRWPVVVITCPKHAEYTIRDKEPLGRMNHATHIRTLVFSPNPISQVLVSVRAPDSGGTLWESAAVHSEGPLYVAEWHPTQFAVGIFYIRVSVKDSTGAQTVLEQPFSLDGSVTKLPLVASFIIAADLTKASKVLFWTVHNLMLVMMFLLKVKATMLRRMHVFSAPVFGPLLHSLAVYASCNNLFKPFVLYQLWIAYGPWFFGALLSNRYALVFVNGILFLDGTFIPSGLNYSFGFLHLIFLDIPLVLIISSILDRNKSYKGSLGSKTSLIRVLTCRFLYFIALAMLMWQCHKCLDLFSNYGIFAVLSNVIEFYCIVMYIYQFYYVFNVSHFLAN